MAEKIVDEFRGILTRDPMFSSENATITSGKETGPEADRPAPDQNTYLQLESYGQFPGNVTPQTLEVKTTKSGPPLLGDKAGRYTVRNTTHSTDKTMGWIPFNQITSFDFLEWVAGSGDGWQHPHAVYLPSGRIVVAYHERTSKNLKIATMDQQSDGWTKQTIETRSMDLNMEPRAQCLVKIPTSFGHRLLLIHQRNTAKRGGQFFFCLGVYISDDNGDTWTLSTEEAPGWGFENVAGSGTTPGGFLITNLKAAYHNGYLTCFVEWHDTHGGGNVHVVDHLVSLDLGSSWIKIEDWAAARGDYIANVNCHAIKNGVLILYHYKESPTTNNDKVRFVVKTNPLRVLSSNPTWGTYTGPAAIANDPISMPAFTSSIGEDGSLYLFGYSDDEGEGFTYFRRKFDHFMFRLEAEDPTTFIADGDYRSSSYFNQSINATEEIQTEDHPFCSGNVGITFLRIAVTNPIQTFCMAPHRGRLCLISGFEGLAGSQESLATVFFGGWSNIDGAGHWGGWHRHSRASDGRIEQNHRSVNFTYVPISKITDYTPVLFDEVTTGVVSHTFSDLGHQATGANCEYHIVTMNASAHNSVEEYHLIASARVNHVGTGNIPYSSGTVAFSGMVGTLQFNDGPNNTGAARYAKCFLMLENTKIQFIETTSAGANTINITTPSRSAVFYDYMISFYRDVPSGKAYAASFYRKSAEEQSGDPWIKIARFDLVGSTSGAATYNSAKFGSFGQSATVTSSIHTKLITFSRSNHRPKFSIAKEDAAYWPDSLQGRPFSIYQNWATNNYRLRALGGPSLDGDTWTVAPRFSQGIALAHPEINPSPRVVFQSVDGTTTDTVIEWGRVGFADHKFERSLIGVHLGGINFPSSTLEGWNGASWIVIKLMDHRINGALIPLRRDGIVFSPNYGSPSGFGRFFQKDELVGGYLIEQSTQKTLKISKNSAGMFTNILSDRIRIVCKNAKATFSNGDYSIIPPAATHIIADATGEFEKYRLKISATKTHEGGHRIGAIVIGPIAIFGKQYSRGRVIGHLPNQEIYEARDGSRMVEEKGPIRRRVDLSWVDFWDLSAIQGDQAGPQHYTASNTSTDPIGFVEDGTIIEGILRRTKGAAVTCVYLPKIKYLTSGSLINLRSKDQFVYGRIVSSATRTAVFGNEDEDELVTIDTITIEEEV